MTRGCDLQISRRILQLSTVTTWQGSLSTKEFQTISARNYIYKVDSRYILFIYIYIFICILASIWPALTHICRKLDGIRTWNQQEPIIVPDETDINEKGKFKIIW